MLIKPVAVSKAKVKGTAKLYGPLSLKTLMPVVLKFEPDWTTVPVHTEPLPNPQRKSTFV